MATNHTTNYQLCQWEATDKVLRTDFNEDNQKIDAALKDNADAISAEAAARAAALSSLSQTVSGKAEASAVPQTASGTYTGTGTSGSGNPCQLRLSFVPRFMFVYSNAPASGWWIRTAEPTVEAQGTMETTGGTATVTWDNDNMVLSWYASSAAVQLNTSGTVYGYLVIG